ncbi:MAG: flagellar motor protein MotB [Sphingobium sp.]
MKARAIALGRRNRWAVSFADLALLLLGFFVLLQASNGRQQEVVSGVAEQFGAPPTKSDRLVARDLFQPGEAMLTSAGEAQISELAKRYAGSGQGIEIRSIGLDPATHRFDNWDLAAARLGAVARAMTAQGIARDRIVIRGLDQQSESRAGQVLLLRSKPSV